MPTILIMKQVELVTKKYSFLTYYLTMSKIRLRANLRKNEKNQAKKLTKSLRQKRIYIGKEKTRNGRKKVPSLA